MQTDRHLSYIKNTISNCACYSLAATRAAQIKDFAFYAYILYPRRFLCVFTEPGSRNNKIRLFFYLSEGIAAKNMILSQFR